MSIKTVSQPIDQILTLGAAGLGVCLPPDAGAAFTAYYELLETHSKYVNLTAISGAEEVARLHFLDCVALVRAADFENARVIDVGSGAGFPGVPIAIAEPTVGLTLLDSTGKRIAFLSRLCTSLGISAVCLHARAEEASRRADMREQFDIAVSRAVARLNVLCELCLPFVRVGGKFLAMKGAGCDEETKEAHAAAAALGGEIEPPFDYTIPGTEINHRVVIIRKSSPTPEEFPRRFSKIKKLIV